MDPVEADRGACPENRGERRRARVSCKAITAALVGVAAVVSSITAFQALKDEKQSNASDTVASAAAQYHLENQRPADSGSRTVLCVASRRTSYAAQIPSHLCTYLVYTDVYFNPRADSFSPVNEATLLAFENASTVDGGPSVLAAIGSPSLHELGQSASLVRRFGEAAARWLAARGFHGLAFVNHRTSTEKLEELVGVLEELKSTMSAGRLEIAISVSLTDWNSPTALVSTRLYSVAQHVDVLVLQTHYFTDDQKCQAGFPTVYTDTKDGQPTVPIANALAWINTLKEDFKVRTSVCFSMTLSVLVFADASTMPGVCKGVRQRSFPTVCDDKRWDRILLFNPHGAVAVNNKTNQLASYEDAAIGARKISSALEKMSSACVAVFDVDMDDYEGVCGPPFARLKSLHDAGSLKEEGDEDINRTTTTPFPEFALRSQPNKCAPRGSNQKALLCILSERADRNRTVSGNLCTHFVYSLRHLDYATALRSVSSALVEDFAGLNKTLLVALNEGALESVPSHELAQQSSAVLRRYGIHGLALLYVTLPAAEMTRMLTALVVLYTTFKEDDLCLLFSAQVMTDLDDSLITVPTLRQIARFTDMLILNTHYAGYVGPCRVMTASTLHEERKTCIPILSMETAAEWLKQAEEASPQGPSMFISVDMRAFRYTVYQPPSLEASCNSEEHVEYAQVCNGSGWKPHRIHSTASAFMVKDSEVVSFETPESVQIAVQTIQRVLPTGSVAVFNADFEDYQGSCHGKPYPRLAALKRALEEVDVGATVAVGPEDRGRDAVSEEIPDEDYDANKRFLVCVVSGELYDNGQVPDRLCTHIVHLGLMLDTNENKVFFSDRALRLAWSHKHTRHLAALVDDGSSPQLAYLERSGQRAAVYVALQVAGYLRRHALHGMALLHINRTTKALSKFAHIVRAMRTVLQPDLSLMVSVEVVDIHVPPKLLAKRLKDFVREVDIFSFETHFYHSRGYCQLEPPSTFETPGRAFTVSMTMALSWIEALSLNQSICLSLNMAVLQFTSPKDRPTCVRRQDVSYSEICDSRDWTILKSNSSDSLARRKETVWQLYEEPELLRNKVYKLIAHSPTACVVAFNIDYEDYKPACGNTSFPRLIAIEKAYDQAEGNVSNDAHALRNTVHEENALQDIFRMTGFLKSKQRRPFAAKQNLAVPMATAERIMSPDKAHPRPFLCFVSSNWSELLSLPRRHCTHYVFDVPQENIAGVPPVLNASEIREYVGVSKKLLVRMEPSFDANDETFQRVVKRLHALGIDGAAIVEQKYLSTELVSLQIFIKLLRRAFGSQYLIVLGVEVEDYDEEPNLISQRLNPLISLSDIVILQTHFKRSWAFCRTAYPSIYKDTGDGCTQSVPMKTALLWARAVSKRGIACISVSMSTHAFRVSSPRPVGASCLSSAERPPSCDKGVSETEDDRSGAAYRYGDDEWLSYETEHMLSVKMRAAEILHPSFCVAVFNVDYDVPPTQCPKKRSSRFGRLDGIAHGAGYKKPEREEKPAPDTKYTDDERNGEPTSLVCVVSDDNREKLLLPEEGCDYVVYQSIVYKDNESFAPRSENNSFEQFTALRERNVEAKYLVALDAEEFSREYAGQATVEEWFTRFVAQLVLFLEENRMHGIAVLELSLPLAELDRVVSALTAIRQYTVSFGFIYALGLTLRDSGNATIAAVLPSLLSLSRSADVLVLESHFAAPGDTNGADNCAVHFPSSAHASVSGSGPALSLEETARILRRLENAVFDPAKEVAPLFCFSVSLAAFLFHVGGAKAGPGTPCVDVRMVPYQETCTPERTDSWSEIKTSLAGRSSYRVKPGAVITFDTVNDIEHKLVSTVHGLTCAAVYAVNFDEHEPVCETPKGIKSFPRFRAVVNSLAVASVSQEGREEQTQDEAASENTTAPYAVFENTTEANETASTTEEVVLGRMKPLSSRKREKRLICTMASVINETLSDIREVCDIVVFMGLAYERNASSLFTRNEASLKTFLSLKNDTSMRLAVELDASDLLHSELNAETEQIAVATLFWMQQHGLERLALFIHDQEFSDVHVQRLVALIKMMRTSLRTVLTEQLKEVIVAVPLQNKVPITSLLQHADIVIYITHHSVPNENCAIVFPSTFGSNRSFSDIEKSDLVPAELPEGSRTKRFCISVSLTVLRFWLSEPVTSLANTICAGESWVSYEQTCHDQESPATYDADAMAVFKEGNGYVLTFENEESLHLKALRIAELFGSETCVAAFYVEYEGNRSVCSSEERNTSRIVELATALQDEHKFTSQPPLSTPPPRREGRMGHHPPPEGSFLVCVLSPNPPSPIILPRAVCGFTVYQHVSFDRTKDRVIPRDGVSFKDFLDLGKRDVSSRLVAGFDDLGFQQHWAKDRLYPGRFANFTSPWAREHALHGIAFMPLNFSALQRAEPSIRALSTMITSRPAVVLGMPRTDDALTVNRVAPFVDVIVFITHHTEPSTPCRVTFPSSRVMNLDSSIFVRQTAQLTNELLQKHRNLESVCLDTNLAVLKYSIAPKHSDLDDACLDEEMVNYAQICSWQGNIEYNIVSGAVLSRKHDSLLTYENEYSLETKARSYLSYSPRGCVAAFNVDYEDSHGACRESFSRLSALGHVLGKQRQPLTGDSARPRRGTLVCVPSSTSRARVDFPFSQCDIFVDGEVEHLYNNVVKTISYRANLHGNLLAATMNWTCFVVSFDVGKAFDNVLDDVESARRRIVLFLAGWVHNEGLCGLAVTEKARTNPVKDLDKFLQELSDAFSKQEPRPKLILLVSAFNDESRLKQLAKYSDLLVLTNDVPYEGKDCRLHGTMTAMTDTAAMLSMNRLLELSHALHESKGDVCFSTTLAVYKYKLHMGLHSAGESCKRMAETTYGEACPPAESNRSVEVSSLTSYTYNKLQMLAFEDERSLRIKMDTFRSRYNRGCVAVFGVDMDTAAANCSSARDFARLNTVRTLLGAPGDRRPPDVTQIGES